MDRPRTPLLSTRDLTCGYGSRAVASGINLDLLPGKVVALLGPNGGGKTTLLRTLWGDLPPLGGEVEIAGKSIRAISAREVAQQVAFVPSEERTEFAFLVREIVLMGRLPHSQGFFDTPDDRRIAEDAMLRADCQHLADRPIHQISAGERQRAILARAIAQQPSVLLLDEPTSHLDPGHQVTFARLVRSLVADGLGVLAAMHDLNLAAELADEVVLLGGGRVIATGTPAAALACEPLRLAYGVDFQSIEGGGATLLRPRFEP